MQYAVVSIGAIGSSVAADLVAAGLPVIAIDPWRDHVEAIRQHGLTVSTSEERTHVDLEVLHVDEVSGLHMQLDVVFVASKAFGAVEAAKWVVPVLSEGASVVGIHNGMTAEGVAEVVGVERSVPAVIELAATVMGPGVIERHTPRSRTWFGIGDGPQTPTKAAAVEALRNVGTVELVSDIVAAKWSKLIVNTMGLAPAALLGINVGSLPSLSDMQPVMLELGLEALKVGRAAGYEPQPLFGLTESDLGDDDGDLVEKLHNTVLGHIGPGAVGVTTRDVRNGRKTEVAEINGRVVTLAQAFGMKAPYNAAVVEVTQQIERGELEPQLSNIARLIQAATAVR